MFTICTYVEHRRHLVRQDVGNTHDGLSVRKPFLFTDSIEYVEMRLSQRSTEFSRIKIKSRSVCSAAPR